MDTNPPIAIVPPSPTGGLKGYLRATRTPAVGAVVTLPLLLIYNLGLIVPGTDEMNGADLLSRLINSTWGLRGMLVLNGGLLVLSVGLIAWLARRGRFRPAWWAALAAEGLAYGFVMAHGVIWLMGHAHLLAAGAGGHSYSILRAISLSAGAGYWEEVVFRLILVGGPIAIARRLVLPPGKILLTGVVAILVSSVAFSVAHYLGGMESPESFSFWFRTFSGVFFSAIFLARGFAAAAYTHFLYDVVVMIF